MADLAARLGVDEASIVVVDEQEVEWPDSSVGCPQPGMDYLQVITPGRLIILEVGGTRYEYHAGAGAPFLCENP